MKMGQYSIPGVRLYPTLVEAVRLIDARFSSKQVEDLDELARSMGHSSAKSGAFLLKLSSLRAFRLVEGRGGVRLTDLARRIAYPKSRNDEAQALHEAVVNIPLWKMLYSSFDNAPNIEDFASKMGDLTGLSAERISAILGKVYKAYVEDVGRLRSLEFASPVKQLAQKEPSPRAEGDEVIELMAGNIHLKLPLNTESIDIVERALRLLKDKISSLRLRSEQT